MTTFTKGQKARRTHGASRYIRIGEEVTVASVDLPALGEHWITLEGHGDKPFLADDFEPVEDTPAPLDPSKVKAGDTVALEREGVTVRGKAGTQRSLGILTAVFISGVGTLYFRDGWTLTDHQPAPEKAPQVFGWADVPAPHGRAHGFLTDRNFVYLVDADDSTGYNVTANFSNFNPDVVINPAEVDRDGLARAIFGAYDTGTFNLPTRERNAIAAGLKFLGLEAS